MKYTIKIYCLVILFIGITKLKSSAQCQGSDTLNLSTGISTSGSVLPTTGIIDPYWQLTNLPPLASNSVTGYAIPNCYTIPTGSAGLGAGFPNWCNIPGTTGLSVIPSPYFNDNNLNLSQPWRFIRKFSITTASFVNFAGSLIGDDIAEMSLYDNMGVQYFNIVGIDHSTIKPFSIDSIHLNQGCYYLEVRVANVGNYAMGFSANVILHSNQNSLANPNNSCCSGSIISGQKWIDKNCDKKVNTGDVPGVGWVFNLLSGSTILQTSTTDANGEFYFNNVSNGIYTVAEVNQTGYTPSNPTSGTTTININKSDTVATAIFLNCKDTLPAKNCAQILNPVIECENGQYRMSFSIKNLSTWDMKGLTINNLDPNIKAVSALTNGGKPFIDIPDIYAGGTSAVITVPLYVPIYSPLACFNFTFCDVNIPNTPTLNCCTVDSICMQVPVCKDTSTNNGHCTNPCDGLTSISYKYADTLNTCCFNLSFINNYLAANIGTISFTGIGGTEFAVTSTSGWTYGGINTATYRELHAPVGGVGAGVYNDFIKMCITSSNPAPHLVLVNYTDVNGVCMCLDTIAFDSCIVVPPSCATIVNDSLYCEDGKTILQFNITNNSTFPIRQLDYFISDTTHFVLKPQLIQFDSAHAIAIGATGGPYKVEVDTVNGGAAQFCFQVSAHNNTYTQNSYATTCCSDAIRQVCLPFINCKHVGCCEFENMIIPNGITPNADGLNDKWVIQKPTNCDSISITVFNRWGNIVYKDANYLNTWGGTNQGGTLLPQSTYFVVIELKNGSKKGLYVDVRY